MARRPRFIAILGATIGALACSGTSSVIMLAAGADAGATSPSSDASIAEGSSLLDVASGSESTTAQSDASKMDAPSFEAMDLDASTALDQEVGTALPRDATADGTVLLSFATDVYPILTARCIACHTPGGSGVLMGHLDLTTGLASGAYSQLLSKAMGTAAGGAATTCTASALTRVVPDSSATSLFFNKVSSKLEGMPALCGNPMPSPAAAPSLTAAQVTTIQSWIDQGANR